MTLATAWHAQYGVVLKYTKDTDISYVKTYYCKMYGLYTHQSNNTNIANFAMADAYSNSGVYLDSSNNTFMTDISIAYSGTNGIYLLATVRTVIANSSVRMCTNAGIIMVGGCCRNKNLQHNYMEKSIGYSSE